MVAQFFHGNDGRGLGASHQTGWTGLVAWSIMQTGEYCRLPRTPRSKSPLPSRFLHCTDRHSTPERGEALFRRAYQHA